MTYIQKGDFLFPMIDNSEEQYLVQTFSQKKFEQISRTQPKLYNLLMKSPDKKQILQQWEAEARIMKENILQQLVETTIFPDKQTCPIEWAQTMNQIEAITTEVTMSEQENL